MLIYNIGLRLLHFLIVVYSAFNAKAKLFVEGRKDSFRKLNEYHQAKQGNEMLYWFHCASLGEFEQARPLIEKIKNTQSETKIAISFFSPSGYEIQKNYALADLVFYLPMATKANADEVLRLLHPNKIFFIKYEFWLHYIMQAHRHNIPVFLVSALFRTNQIFFQWYGKLFYNILDKYAEIFVQDEASFNLLKENNIKSVITGDTRFDRVLANKAKAQKNTIIESFAGNKKIIVLGSSWQPEEELIFNTYDPMLNYKIIIAPHDIKRNIAIPDSITSMRYSMAKEGNIADKEVLIIDNIGMLSTLYNYASLAFVGGGYRGSLHNILEAAVFGIPVLYGPQTQKHPEAEALQAAGGGMIIQNEAHLKTILHDLFTNETLRINMGADAFRYIESNSGATQKIISSI
jgi:3-deoxy-D-manno-octulosonic-acid transferase